jgi:beta-mannosidase
MRPTCLPLCRWGDTNSWEYGDAHFYTYCEDVFNPAVYPRAKFISEFGFMSLPSFTGKPPLGFPFQRQLLCSTP